MTEEMRYEAVYGFNSKQWWAYDSETGEVVDIPVEVLEEVKKLSDVVAQEDYLNDLLASEPEWLDDGAYRYGEDFEI